MRCYKEYENIYSEGRIYGHLPFAFTIHLMLREGDILVVEIDAQFEGHLSQVFIGGPLEAHI